jgi:hypothetical protein
MGLANRLVTMWLDHRGTVGKMVVYVAAAVLDPSGVAVQAVKDALNLLSAAVVTKETITKSNDIAGTSPNPPTQAGYHSDIDDRIVFHFMDTDGQSHFLEVPAPVDNAFVDAANDDEVDLTADVITDVRDAIVANFKSAEGLDLAFVTAFYARRQADAP